MKRNFTYSERVRKSQEAMSTPLLLFHSQPLHYEYYYDNAQSLESILRWYGFSTVVSTAKYSESMKQYEISRVR